MLAYFAQFPELLQRHQSAVGRVDVARVDRSRQAAWLALRAGDPESVATLMPELRTQADEYGIRYDDSIEGWLRDLARLTRAAAIRAELRDAAVTLEQDPDGFLDRVLALRDQMAHDSKAEWHTVADVMVSGTIQQSIERVPTCITCLDQVTGGGFPRARMSVVGARPSVGKSALASSVAVARASVGHKTAVVSLEMDEREYAIRCLSSLEGVSQSQVTGLHGYLPATTQTVPLISVLDTPVSDYAVIKRAIKNLLVTDPYVDLVFIDYLQLMDAAGHESRVRELSYITHDLHLLARETRCAIVALAQVSRDGDNIRPMLRHLKDSGSIEQDSAMVVFLHDPQPDRVNMAEPHRREVIVRKNRNGPTGFCPVGYIPTRTHFVDPECCPEPVSSGRDRAVSKGGDNGTWGGY